MRDTLRWLPVVDRIAFKTIMLTRDSIVVTAPAYTKEYCALVYSQPGRRSLRSTAHGDTQVPRCRASTFSCVGVRVRVRVTYCCL